MGVPDVSAIRSELLVLVVWLRFLNRIQGKLVLLRFKCHDLGLLFLVEFAVVLKLLLRLAVTGVCVIAILGAYTGLGLVLLELSRWPGLAKPSRGEPVFFLLRLLFLIILVVHLSHSLIWRPLTVFIKVVLLSCDRGHHVFSRLRRTLVQSGQVGLGV